MGLFQKIQHIFPIRGHSFLPSDRDFAKTESKKKKVDRLYLPNDWIDVIRSAKKVKPFTVVPVSQGFVYDFQSHLKPCFKKSVPGMRVHNVYASHCTLPYIADIHVYMYMYLQYMYMYVCVYISHCALPYFADVHTCTFSACMYLYSV